MKNYFQNTTVRKVIYMILFAISTIIVVWGNIMCESKKPSKICTSERHVKQVNQEQLTPEYIRQMAEGELDDEDEYFYNKKLH